LESENYFLKTKGIDRHKLFAAWKKNGDKNQGPAMK
jgi:hypothetical protein